MEDDDDDTPVPGAANHEAAIVRYKMERKQLRQALKDAQEQIATLKTEATEAGKAAKAAEKVQGELDQYKAKEADWAIERTILGAGISGEDAPEAVDMIRLAWGRVPEGERPKGGIGDWLKSDKLPKAVRAYLPQQQQGQQGQQQQGQRQGQGQQQGQQGGNVSSQAPPNPNQGARSPGGTNTGFGPVSGLDANGYKQNRDAIFEQLGMKAPSWGPPPGSGGGNENGRG